MTLRLLRNRFPENARRAIMDKGHRLHPLNNPCPCGSGQLPHEQLDGHGIFLFYGCSECIPLKLRRYRPDILEHYETEEPIDND